LKELDDILRILLEEQNHNSASLPAEQSEKLKWMRMLMNIRQPLPVSAQFLKAQDSVLNERRRNKGDVLLDSIPDSGVDNRIRLWQGDITRLKVDAIVNAANSQMLGCFSPLHACIDNAIHSAAGVQLRLECHEQMTRQGHPEPTGKAKITRGYNLPASYVIHTVGPIIQHDEVTIEDENLLASCYLSCLALADEYQLKSIAFCCISTGEFRFPNQRAAEIAIATVSDYFNQSPQTSIETVVFNVFKDLDYSIYQQLLQKV